MQKQEELQERLEQLEKELWYLAKNTLPALREELLEAGNNGNKAKLEELEGKITACQTTITQLEGEVVSIKSRLSAVETSASQTSQNLTSLSSVVTQNTADIADTKSSISTLEDDLLGNTTDITSMKNAITTLEGSVATNQTSIASNQSNISSNQSSISTNQANIASLSTRVTNLENKPSSSGGGRSIEVIYDMNSTDANINKGLTSGAPGGNYIYWDGDDYDYLRIFASLNNLYSFIEIPMENRPKNDFIMTAAAATGKVIHIFKGVIYKDTKRIALSRGFTYTFNADTGTFAFVAGNDKHIITRVEGVKGI